jgi:peroxiredoxin
MYSSRFACILILSMLAGCGGMKDDLLPSASDQRLPVIPGSLGSAVSQLAPDFTASDSLGNSITLSSVTPLHKGVVMYFTMWCPTCDAHMAYIRDNLISQPSNSNVVFYAVDYVSGSVAESRQAQLDHNFGGSGFIVLADTSNSILGLYHATMATTVVIDRNGIVRMNEQFKTTKLQDVLAALP